jgi:hypothetical protein
VRLQAEPGCTEGVYISDRIVPVDYENHIVRRLGKGAVTLLAPPQGFLGFGTDPASRDKSGTEGKSDTTALPYESRRVCDIIDAAPDMGNMRIAPVEPCNRSLSFESGVRFHSQPSSRIRLRKGSSPILSLISFRPYRIRQKLTRR